MAKSNSGINTFGKTSGTSAREIARRKKLVTVDPALRAAVVTGEGRSAIDSLSDDAATKVMADISQEEAAVEKALQKQFESGNLAEAFIQYQQSIQEIYYASVNESTEDPIAGADRIKNFYLPELDDILENIKQEDDTVLSDEQKETLIALATKVKGLLESRLGTFKKLTARLGKLFQNNNLLMGAVAAFATRSPVFAVALFAMQQGSNKKATKTNQASQRTALLRNKLQRQQERATRSEAPVASTGSAAGLTPEDVTPDETKSKKKTGRASGGASNLSGLSMDITTELGSILLDHTNILLDHTKLLTHIDDSLVTIYDVLSDDFKLQQNIHDSQLMVDEETRGESEQGVLSPIGSKAGASKTNKKPGSKMGDVGLLLGLGALAAFDKEIQESIYGKYKEFYDSMPGFVQTGLNIAGLSPDRIEEFMKKDPSGQQTPTPSPTPPDPLADAHADARGRVGVSVRKQRKNQKTATPDPTPVAPPAGAPEAPSPQQTGAWKATLPAGAPGAPSPHQPGATPPAGAPGAPSPQQTAAQEQARKAQEQAQAAAQAQARAQAAAQAQAKAAAQARERANSKATASRNDSIVYGDGLPPEAPSTPSATKKGAIPFDLASLGQAGAGGPVHPGTMALASYIHSTLNVSGNARMKQITAFNDKGHVAGFHKKGLAMDFTLKGDLKTAKKNAPKVKAKIQALANAAGVGVTILDEYNNPSSGKNLKPGKKVLPHIHVGFKTEEDAEKFLEYAKDNQINSPFPVKVVAGQPPVNVPSPVGAPPAGVPTVVDATSGSDGESMASLFNGSPSASLESDKIAAGRSMLTAEMGNPMNKAIMGGGTGAPVIAAINNTTAGGGGAGIPAGSPIPKTSSNYETSISHILGYVRNV